MTARRELVNLSEASRRTGVPRRTLSSWASRGHLGRPAGLEPDGTRLYDLAHLTRVITTRRRAQGPRLP